MNTTMTPDERTTLARLLRESRWAALATARDNELLASWVAVVPEDAGFLMHISHLALHTRYLLANPRASLAFSEPDADSSRDPQTLVRVSVQGNIEWISRYGADWDAARSGYLARLPHAAVQFDLGDFYLARLVAQSARYVPGFGRVHLLDADELQSAICGP
jgi:hypothetical protein